MLCSTGFKPIQTHFLDPSRHRCQLQLQAAQSASWRKFFKAEKSADAGERVRLGWAPALPLDQLISANDTSRVDKYRKEGRNTENWNENWEMRNNWIWIKTAMARFSVTKYLKAQTTLVFLAGQVWTGADLNGPQLHQPARQMSPQSSLVRNEQETGNVIPSTTVYTKTKLFRNRE